MKTLSSALCLILVIGCAADSGTANTQQENTPDARAANTIQMLGRQIHQMFLRQIVRSVG